jgi:TfoX N-terminal domain
MPYDEKLAGRVRRLLADREDVSEQAMFGGLTFMVAGRMCCGVNKDELIVRLHPDEVDAALVHPHARPMDFTGRPMRGFVTIGPEGLNGQALKRWVGSALSHAQGKDRR